MRKREDILNEFSGRALTMTSQDAKAIGEILLDLRSNLDQIKEELKRSNDRAEGKNLQDRRQREHG